MIAIATQAANGLNQQGEFVVIKRLLQAAHHRDFILQVALQMDGPTLLKIFRMVEESDRSATTPSSPSTR